MLVDGQSLCGESVAKLQFHLRADSGVEPALAAVDPLVVVVDVGSALCLWFAVVGAGAGLAFVVDARAALVDLPAVPVQVFLKLLRGYVGEVLLAEVRRGDAVAAFDATLELVEGVGAALCFGGAGGFEFRPFGLFGCGA